MEPNDEHAQKIQEAKDAASRWRMAAEEDDVMSARWTAATQLAATWDRVVQELERVSLDYQRYNEAMVDPNGGMR